MVTAMVDFASLSVEEMVRPEGYECSCGRIHSCALDYLKIGRGAIAAVPEMLKKMGASRPYVLCDGNTYRVAGEKVCAILKEAGIDYVCYVLPGERPAPAEWEVGSAAMHFDASCDVILGVGSGVINDTCKVLAHTAHLKSAIVGTAPSMDGYASNSSSMEMNHVKVSLYNHAPTGIILDTEILSQAPMRMLWAGLGDMVAKYIALCEWRISHIVTGEYYCENIAEQMREALRRIVANADGITKRDPEAIGAIAEGLMIAGIAMAYAEISRPASGLEHYFSHMWEMMALDRNQPYDLHGIQVGIGTVLTMRLYQFIIHEIPDREAALAFRAGFDPEAWREQVKRIFGKTADEIFAIEEKAQKNSAANHEKRLNNIVAHWDEIVTIMKEELPDFEKLYVLLKSTGMPMTPGAIGLPMQDTIDAFLGSRDIRNKYLTSSMLWDLGLIDKYTKILEEVAEKQEA